MSVGLSMGGLVGESMGGWVGGCVAGQLACWSVGWSVYPPIQACENLSAILLA